MTREIRIKDMPLGGRNPLVLIAGPCVIEGLDLTLHVATALKEITASLSIPFIFKTSYDKANRSSLNSYRGPGLKKGLKVLQEVKEKLNIPVLSDVHRFEEIETAASVLDVIQIPAFLSRQTDFIIKVAETGRVVNIKKGQFMSPPEVKNVIDKVTSTGNHQMLVTERGFSFGYNNLVVDMCSLVILQKFGYPVVFDATHSVQLPGGLGSSSGGQREFITYLSRAAVATGIDALFIEVHPEPDNALCDGSNMLNLSIVPSLLKQVKLIDNMVKSETFK